MRNLDGLRVGISGAIPSPAELAENGWSDFDIRITVLRMVETLLGNGAMVVHGTHPTFLPLIRTAAETTRREGGGKNVTMFVVRSYLAEGDEERLTSEHGWYANLRFVDELQTMREQMIAMIDILVCIGGRGIRPDVPRPGVAVESGLALEQGKPVFFAAGLGGFTQAMLKDRPQLPPNGLTKRDNKTLISEKDPMAIVDLVAKGIEKCAQRQSRRRSGRTYKFADIFHGDALQNVGFYGQPRLPDAFARRCYVRPLDADPRIVAHVKKSLRQSGIEIVESPSGLKSSGGITIVIDRSVKDDALDEFVQRVVALFQ